MRRAVYVLCRVTKSEVIEKPYVEFSTRQIKEETVIPYLSAPPL